MNIYYRPLNIKEDWAYVQARTKPKLVEDTCGIVAIDTETSERVAVVVFDTLWPTSAQIHFAIDDIKVLNHGFREVVADFIFNHHGKKTVIGLVPAMNKKALAFNTRSVGFKEVYRVPDGFKDGHDMVMLQMRKEDCPHLPKIKEELSA